MTNSPESLKHEILRLTSEYSKLVHADFLPANHPLRPAWRNDQSIPYAGRVFDNEEVVTAVSSVLDFWLTLGKEGQSFESELQNYLGVKSSILTNSGSSANLLAISALTSHKIDIDRRLLPGDEVITVAAGFPTTVAPILQVGAVPVFIDVCSLSGNICVDQIESAYRNGKTKAVVLAHALGNPFNLLSVLQFCRKHNLWLVEDNCDSLGSTYSIPVNLANELGFFKDSPGVKTVDGYITRFTGTWGDLSTQSFYPPHHITMGEGGSVNIIRDIRLRSIVESFRDWGRDCWCPSGIDNSCSKRFGWSLGDLPSGYDHKYTYSHLGFNLKPLDPQAAIGRVQLSRLDEFVLARKHNWSYLREGLDELSEFIDFSLPEHAVSWNSIDGFAWDSSGCRTSPSWFGFKLSVKESAPFSRTDLARELDINNIGNRMLFGGNLLRQPALVALAKLRPSSFRVVGSLDESDRIMNNDLFLGTYPGLTVPMLDKMINVVRSFVLK